MSSSNPSLLEAFQLLMLPLVTMGLRRITLLPLRSYLGTLFQLDWSLLVTKQKLLVSIGHLLLNCGSKMRRSTKIGSILFPHIMSSNVGRNCFSYTNSHVYVCLPWLKCPPSLLCLFHIWNPTEMPSNRV